MEFVHFLGTLLLGANYLGPVLESGFGVWERQDPDAQDDVNQIKGISLYSFQFILILIHAPQCYQQNYKIKYSCAVPFTPCLYQWFLHVEAVGRLCIPTNDCSKGGELLAIGQLSNSYSNHYHTHPTCLQTGRLCLPFVLLHQINVLLFFNSLGVFGPV